MLPIPIMLRALLVQIVFVSGSWLPFCRAESVPIAVDAVEPTLQSVVFYSSGLAHFRYEAQIDQATTLNIAVPHESVSDVLRTLSVVDSAKGLRSVVVKRGSVGAHTSPVDENNLALESRIDCLLSLRGQLVEFILSSGQLKSGRLMSIEQSVESFGDSITERVRVSFLGDSGLDSVLAEDVERFRCVDKSQQAALEQKIIELAQTADSPAVDSMDTVAMEIEGAASRVVTIGFMQAMPVWKCSYTLTDDSLLLHVVIDNPTHADWDNVEVSIADGRPIAFGVDLHRSITLQRKQVALPVGLPGLPPTMDERVDLPGGAFGGDLAGPGFGGMGGGYGGETYGGGGYGGMGGMGGMMGGMGAPAQSGQQSSQQGSIQPYPSNLSAVVSAPQSSDPFADALGLDFRDQAQREEHVKGAPLVLHFPPRTIPAHSSALFASQIPDCSIDHRSVYSPEYNSQTPLMAVELINQSDTLLPAGPLTFQSDGLYQGESMLARTSSGGRRLINYALDTGIEVSEQQAKQTDSVLKTVFDEDNKTLTVHRISRRIRTFDIQNSLAKARTVVIHLPADDLWKPVLEDGDQLLDTGLQIEVEAQPTSTTARKLTLEMPRQTTLSYGGAELDTLKQLLSDENVANRDRQQIQKIVNHRIAVLQLSNQIDQIEQLIDERQTQVDRLVKILSTEGLQAATVQRYAARIEQQESELEVLVRQLRTSQSTLHEHENALYPLGSEQLQEHFDPFGELMDNANTDLFSDPFGGDDDPFSEPPSKSKR